LFQLNKILLVVNEREWKLSRPCKLCHKGQAELEMVEGKREREKRGKKRERREREERESVCVP
jgi:hypothetical protein